VVGDHDGRYAEREKDGSTVDLDSKWTLAGYAPAPPGSILVNGGDLLRRRTNDRFLATPHRVINRSGQERYAIPFFMDCDYDWRMECLPSCTDAETPSKYEPITYPEYMTWFWNLNYAQAVKSE
jgi:isopenicillin N synthase-like dioxygenase